MPVLKQLGAKHQLIVSIGGGRFIREYYDSIRRLKLSHEEMEWIAIELLRVNTRFLAFLLNTKPLYSLKELRRSSRGVIGGIAPGRSTDANAAYAASVIKADYFIKLTNVNGVYDKDPRAHRNAHMLSRIPFSALPRYAAKGEPGNYGVLDKRAVETIARHRIRTVVMNGTDPLALLKVVNGKRIGTLIAD